MATYMKHFPTENEFNTARNSNYVEPWISVTDGRGLDYNKSEEEKKRSKYLTFDIIQDGTLGFKMLTNSAPCRTISYRLNGGSWTNITPTTNGVAFNVVIGDVVECKGENPYYGTFSNQNFFFGTSKFNLSGNLTSLIYGDNFLNGDDPINSYAFSSLFKSSGVIDASELILPETVSQYTYHQMFKGCVSLVYAPSILPATIMANYCYDSMFEGCEVLTSAPVLPATTLAESCYNYMFNGCTSLTTAPVLPAETLVSNCYYRMFYGCSSLNYIKAMFKTNPTSAYTYNWVYNVSSTGTFVKNTSATWTATGSNAVPTGWTIQTATE